MRNAGEMPAERLVRVFELPMSHAVCKPRGAGEEALVADQRAFALERYLARVLDVAAKSASLLVFDRASNPLARRAEQRLRHHRRVASQGRAAVLGGGSSCRDGFLFRLCEDRSQEGDDKIP